MTQTNMNKETSKTEFEFMKQTIKNNDKKIDNIVNKLEQDYNDKFEQMREKYKNVHTNPDYVKKGLVAQEKLKLISSFRLMMSIMAIFLFFSPIYNSVFGWVVAIIGVCLWAVPTIAGWKEEKRLCETYSLKPSKFVGWLGSYRKKAKLNVDHQKINELEQVKNVEDDSNGNK